MPNLALIDLITPYLLRGENLGAQHAALSVVRVVTYDTAADDFGIVVRGRCEFNGYASIDRQGAACASAPASTKAQPPTIRTNGRPYSTSARRRSSSSCSCRAPARRSLPPA
jgi:hypothetical protein